MISCPFKKWCIKELEGVKQERDSEWRKARSQENHLERLHRENESQRISIDVLLAKNEQLKEASAIKTVRVLLVKEEQ